LDGASEGIILSQLRQRLGTAELKVDPSLFSEVNENIFESLDEIFRDVKHRSLLILEHAHAPDLVNNILSKVFSKDTPHEGDCLESLLKFEFDCYEVFLAGEKRTCMQLLLIVT
jgi:hypothetical protein